MAEIISFADYRNRQLQQRTACAVKPKKASYYPEQQGSLDGLCGIYSVVNAVSYIAKLSAPQRNKLFEKLVHKLHKKIAVNIIDGTSQRQLQSLLKVSQRFLADSYNIKIEFAPLFRAGVELDLENYLRYADIFLKYPRSAIIVEMDGIHSHWTCFTAITKKTIQLLDSDGLSVLRTATCRISKKSQAKFHCLHPSRTWGVRIEKE